MNKQIFNKILPHITAVALFFAISFIYFSPLLEGKIIQQHDKTTFLGTSKEISDFREATGEEALWTNSIFGGMPACLISVKSKSNLIKPIDIFLKTIKRPASQVFLGLLGFYITLLMFGVNPWLSIAGAIAFTFSSYYFIIIAAGHNMKVFAIAYMSPIIAGIYKTYRGKILLGAAVTSLFLALQLLTNHYQITYYTLIIVLIFGIVELVYTIKKNTWNQFLKATGVLVIVAIIAVATNSEKTLPILEYGKYSIRGKSELTSNKENQTSGLDKDYITAWSYGVTETLTVLIPDFKGGASAGSVGENSASFKFFSKIQGDKYASQVVKQLPLYWGDQPGTSGPVYFGAIIMFFFVLGIFILGPKIKWWLLSATVLSVMLSWGHNFPFLTNIFLDYVPGYNKFRVVAMTLVIAQFTVPLMAILALKKVFENNDDNTKIEKAFRHSFYIVGGISLFFALFPGLFFDFAAPSDQGYIAQGGQAFVDALREDRKVLLRADAFRSFVFILLSAVVVYAFIKKKLKKNYVFTALIALILIDMWAIDKRYLNNDNFISKRQDKETFKKTQADIQILQDTDPDYRVLNLTVDPFNDASTSYYHKSIGGYHGAKMRRYQELIEHQISKNNMDVLNMLNTKYFIVPDKNRQPAAQYNPEALGNAWFVEDYRIVPDADAEIQALSQFDPSTEAIVDKRFEDFVQGKNFTKDTLSSISLEKYEPNDLKYKANCASEKLAVFSEIYYPKGWKAYIDGKITDHFRVNYVLRAMVIPEGEHTIEFVYKPESYFLGKKISFAASSILLLFIIFAFGKELVLYYKENDK